jgi:hypothetical protein
VVVGFGCSIGCGSCAVVVAARVVAVVVVGFGFGIHRAGHRDLQAVTMGLGSTGAAGPPGGRAGGAGGGPWRAGSGQGLTQDPRGPVI